MMRLPAGILRGLAPEDLPAAHALSQTVGWPHRLSDWQFLYDLGEGVVMEGAGTLAGVALWWPFAPASATLGLSSVGLVIVSPDQQGRGLGRRLMEAVLERADPKHVLRLNATPAGAPLYRALGFRNSGEVRQHQGRLRAGARCPAGSGIRPLRPADRQAVAHLDRAATGLDRSTMLGRLHAVSSEELVLERGGQVVAYGLRRAFGRGEVLGPVVATGEMDALAIVQPLAAAAVGFVRIDIPADGRAVAAWLDAAGLPEVDAVTTMIRGTGGPVPDRLAVYGLAAQAVG